MGRVQGTGVPLSRGRAHTWASRNARGCWLPCAGELPPTLQRRWRTSDRADPEPPASALVYHDPWHWHLRNTTYPEGLGEPVREHGQRPGPQAHRPGRIQAHAGARALTWSAGDARGRWLHGAGGCHREDMGRSGHLFREVPSWWLLYARGDRDRARL